jgi:MerR family transcriptional regulator, light-induced transcriptional regulator
MPPGEPIRTLRTSEAAALLSVSPTTLREWERTFGYPRPARSPGQHRRYAYSELISLREALDEGLSISSAVSVVRAAESSQLPTLLGPLHGFDAERADHVMECALAVRSLEASVKDVLLPTLHEIERADGVDSAVWSFALGWSIDWVMRAKRVVETAPHARCVVVGDATRDALDIDIVYLRAFELFCLRAGIGVLHLHVLAHRAAALAVTAVEAQALVLAGKGSGNAALGRFRRAAFNGALPLPTFLYRSEAASPDGPRALSPCPLQAQHELLGLLADVTPGRAPTRPGDAAPSKAHDGEPAPKAAGGPRGTR